MSRRPYETCPVIEGHKFLLRLAEPGDAEAIEFWLKSYEGKWFVR